MLINQLELNVLRFEHMKDLYEHDTLFALCFTNVKLNVGVKTGGSRVGGPELCVYAGW